MTQEQKDRLKELREYLENNEAENGYDVDDIEEEVERALNCAKDAGYIADYASEATLDELTCEIFGWMNDPSYEDDLDDEQSEYAELYLLTLAD